MYQASYYQDDWRGNEELGEDLDLMLFEYDNNTALPPSSLRETPREHTRGYNRYEEDINYERYEADIRGHEGDYNSYRHSHVHDSYQNNDITLRTNPDYDNTPYDDIAMSTHYGDTVASHRDSIMRKPDHSHSDRHYQSHGASRSTTGIIQPKFRTSSTTENYRYSSTRKRSESLAVNERSFSTNEYGNFSDQRKNTYRHSRRSNRNGQARKSSQTSNAEKFKHFPSHDKKAPIIPLPDYEGSTVQYVPEPDY